MIDYAAVITSRITALVGPSVRLSVSLSCTKSWLDSKKARKTRIGVNVPRAGVTGVLIFRSKRRRSRSSDVDNLPKWRKLNVCLFVAYRFTETETKISAHWLWCQLREWDQTDLRRQRRRRRNWSSRHLCSQCLWSDRCLLHNRPTTNEHVHALAQAATLYTRKRH